MKDIYTEQLVKRKKGKKHWLLEGILLVVTLLSIYGAFRYPLLLIVTVILIAGNIFLYLELDVEYEYLFVNGEMSIDKIIHKSKRRRICTIAQADMEILAPYGAGELRQYQRAHKVDYSSGVISDKTYVMVVSVKGKKKKLFLEPNKTMIDAYARLDPRKVVSDSVR